MERRSEELTANNSEAQVPYSSGGGGGEESCPKYKGVRKRKWGKWVSEVRLPNSRERIWLGSYDTAEKAARAFDAAQFCLRGRHAHFNFPDSPPDIPGGLSLSPQEIQVVAARFAEQQDQQSRNDDDITDDQSSCSLVQEPPNPNFPPLASDHHGHVMATNNENNNYNTDYWSFLNYNLDCSSHEIGGSGYYDNFDDQYQQLMHSGEYCADHVPVLRADADDSTNENVLNNGDHDLFFSQHYSSSFLWNF